MLFGCELIGGGDDTPDDGPGDGVIDGGDEGDGKPILLKLLTPTVYISDRGVASWNDVYGATAYRVVINGEERLLTSTQIQLKDGDTISVCAIGNGETTKDSSYSALYIYEAKAPVTETPISDMATAPLDQIYAVKGYVCAAGKSNLLLTDNKGNYIYVYTVDPHGYTVGDEVKFTGTKAAYWNVYELKDIISSELVSSGNEIQTPFVKEGTADYFEDKLDNFTVGELVTVTGRLAVSGNYYNFEVAGLDGALLSLAYNGTLEDGKDYTVTGYLAFVSGSSAKYINIIVTDIKEINNDEPPEVCEICGVSVLFGDHSKLGCGHYACDGGEHTQLDCGHYACDGMEHHILDCGHRICDDGEHTVLGCGHFACEGGEHGSCAYCGGYLCTGDHSLCGGTEIIYCDACHGSIYEGDHTLQNCGHYICVDGEHGMYGCGHFTCEDGDHTLLDCGHYECEGGDHTLYGCGHCASMPGSHIECDKCGKYLCTGDHSSCGGAEEVLCNICGNNFLVGDHNMLSCGHYACEDGEHVLCERCETYRCQGDHTECDTPSEYCEICGGSIYVGDHYELDCGHCASLDGEHSFCERCGEYLCDGLDHTLYSCGHTACEGGEHYELACGHFACEGCEGMLCPHCGEYLCNGEDHSSCGEPEIIYCEVCGKDSSVGEHNTLECGHKACAGGEHGECPDCSGYLCVGEHEKLECGHRSCMGGSHSLLACGHYECQDGEHERCIHCGKYLCTGDHLSCGKPEIERCEICGGDISVGEHDELDCGHYACDGDDHSPCLICDEPLCIGTHGEGMCVKLSGFDEIYLGENGDIFTTEGIICAMGAYEFLITDNEGNYLHVGFDEPHTYKTGDLIRITGNKVAYGNTSYDLIPIEIATVSEEVEFIVTEPIAVDLDYFENGVSGGYKMGEYIRFVGYLDPSTDMFIVDGEYVGVVWTGIDIYYNERYIVTAYLYYLDSIDGYWVIATGFADESSVQYCSVCGGPLAIGDHYVQDCGHYICLGVHEMLPCGHYSCESGDHSQCGACGGYYCHGGSHTVCYGCKSLTCDGRVHDFCDTCGWFLCVGNHDLLECGHKACSGGDHQRCGVCGEFYCHGGDHSMMSCGHLVCSGGEHKICPSCYEPTCMHPIIPYANIARSTPV